MNQYLLALHAAPGGDCHSMSPEEMAEAMKPIDALEKEMKAAGVWMFSGGLTGPESATVVRNSDGKVVTTDGMFVESKEHLAGIYIIQAADLDAALAWASKVTQTVGRPIEVRAFWPHPGE